MEVNNDILKLAIDHAKLERIHKKKQNQFHEDVRSICDPKELDIDKFDIEKLTKLNEQLTDNFKDLEIYMASFYDLNKALNYNVKLSKMYLKLGNNIIDEKFKEAETVKNLILKEEALLHSPFKSN